MTISFTPVDLMISDNAWKNIEIMKLNGFTTTYMIAVYIINAIYGHATSYQLYRVTLKDEEVDFHFDLQLIIPVIIILLIGDYFFYFSHKLLHSTEFGAKLHLMHHCCIYTTLSTNAWFHPLDLLIEFWGPFSLNYLYWLYSGDTFVLMVVGGIMTAWYSATHDERISNHHRDHHRLINSDYPIYISYNVPNPKDKVKHMVKE